MKRDLTGKSRQLNVVLFSGGRGSGALARQLVRHPQVSLTIAINGYDDGLSTGEVRRFLGDALGPSDFRKNATRVARELETCSKALIDLLELRLPVGSTSEEAMRVFCLIRDGRAAAAGAFEHHVKDLAAATAPGERAGVTARLDAFARELGVAGRAFDFSDCSLGNLVFAGTFLTHRRVFNAALDDYCALFGLVSGLVDNVTDGTNAFLVAIDVDDRLLGSEGEIVDAKHQNRIKDIYLIDHALDAAERRELASLAPQDMATRLESAAVTVRLNARLAGRLASADLIVYAPGTQHSSLFPSYLTPDLSAAIAGNLRAVKLLITNIHSDAEIAGSDAVDIIRRAVYYLQEKGRLAIPTPLLITHYLINDPGQAEAETPYVPLGKLDSLEDPRLVRIGHFEEGVSGRHDAVKVLTPFIDAHLSDGVRRSAAVWLYDSVSADKISQTLLEIVRADVTSLPLQITLYCSSLTPLPAVLLQRLPFRVENVPATEAWRHVHERLRADTPDYLVLFESSGMYVGEDLVELLSHLTSGRLDAVWGSRRLSVRDIAESMRTRYQHRPLLRTASRIGSFALSLAYLFFYGRYVSDTLSGARAVRSRYALAAAVDPADKLGNQRLLSVLLRDRAEFLEIPVRFFPLSPERVRRTNVQEGLESLAMIAWWRLKGVQR